MNPPPTLLDALDAQQDEVIRRLDELNERVEAVLHCWTKKTDAASEQESVD